jgi:excisionase family DNA binding protein
VTAPAATFEGELAERVAACLAPLLLERIEAALDRRLPPQLGSVAEVCRATGLSAATVRRRIADGSFASTKVGGRVLVDLSSFRPTETAEIAKLAARARRGS